jgi:hypothetical protein
MVKDAAPTVATRPVGGPGYVSVVGQSNSTVTTSAVPEARRLELLRHYRYHVASWVRTFEVSCFKVLSNHLFAINLA